MLQCRDIDGLMVDWLYEELAGEASAGFAAHLESCGRCSVEVDGLRRTREAFRELSPEEPPASVTAILLHEAARRAPAPERARTVAGEPAPGFWERIFAWLRPLATHPAAAAVASLVLVAGVAGVLYVKTGGLEVASPDVASEAAPAVALGDLAEKSDDTRRAEEGKEALAAAADPDPEQDALRLEGGLAKSGAAAGELADGYAAELLDGERKDELERRGVERRRQPPAPTGGATGTARPAPGPKKSQPAPDAPVVQQSTRADRDAEPTFAGDLGDGGKATRGRGSAAGGPGGVEEQARAPNEGEARQVTVSASIEWARTQERRLVDAAKKDDCRSAAMIANDILDRAPRYYDERISGSAAIRSCRTSVATERSRRAAVRRSSDSASQRAPAPVDAFESAK